VGFSDKLLVHYMVLSLLSPVSSTARIGQKNFVVVLSNFSVGRGEGYLISDGPSLQGESRFGPDRHKAIGTAAIGILSPCLCPAHAVTALYFLSSSGTRNKNRS
jgi:hypothetical protein